MTPRTPITLITGPLGSGKTTLLRHILATKAAKIAIVMNEFGEIAIDTKVIEGKNVRIAELGGGCVCCSLLGEFEAAVNEIIEKVAPEMIIVETTGLAEPEALAFNIQEALPQCRLDGVVSVIDADMLVRFPELGHTTRLQIEGADILLLNKIDLVDATEIERSKRSCTKLTRLLQSFAPSAAKSIRNYCSVSDAKKKSRTQGTSISRNSNRSLLGRRKFFLGIVSHASQTAFLRTWFGRKASCGLPMARSFSISSPDAGTWSRSMRVIPSWCSSERTLHRKNRQSSMRWMNALRKNDEAQTANE